VVAAAAALPGLGVAGVRVPVAVAGPAGGEAPLARLAVGALAPRGPLPARTLARGRVALVADRALGVAVTRWGAREGGWAR